MNVSALIGLQRKNSGLLQHGSYLANMSIDYDYLFVVYDYFTGQNIHWVLGMWQETSGQMIREVVKKERKS